MPLTVSLLAAASMFLLCSAGLARGPGVARGRALAMSPAPRSRGVSVSSWLERIGRGPAGRITPGGPEVVRRMEVAGRPMSMEAMAGTKACVAMGALLTTALAALAEPAAILLTPIALALGHRLPDVVLARVARRRRGKVAAHVLDMVEALVATSEAGLGPSEAFRRSAGALVGPMREELERVVREIDLGVPWRAAFDGMDRRLGIPSLRRLAVAMGRSQRLGAGLRTTLRSLASDLREERRARAEESARRAPVKMLFPLIFLILPAFLLLTVGPVLVATLRSLQAG